MKVFIRALLWSTGLEVFLVAMWALGYVGLPLLSYIALWCHFPALYICPPISDSLVGTFVFQWLIWLVLFVGALLLRRAFTHVRAVNERHTG
jgi:hypothetical protein